MENMKVAIIGAGAAGCFCAVELSRRLPDARITVYEAGKRPLAKLAVTGGGRCNFTNSWRDVRSLEEVYPRGAQLMKRALHNFSADDARAWFEAEGVPSVVQEDQCVFPVSQDAMQVVRTLEALMHRHGVQVMTDCRVEDIRDIDADVKIVTTGGGAIKLLEPLDKLETVRPVPSLFTFKLADAGLRSLMGTVVKNVTTSLAGTPFRATGTLLVTDWGVSGPCTLKLSSYAARHLADNGYKGTLSVNWLGANENGVRQILSDLFSTNPGKRVVNTPPEGISSRMWKHLVLRAGIPKERVWAEVGGKMTSRLATVLTSDAYEITGRCHFKEEFVTAGGVSLSSVNISTLEARAYPGLYFAGEVLDVDAVTGGFNLQAAWSTAWTVAQSIAKTSLVKSADSGGKIRLDVKEGEMLLLSFE